MKDELSEIGLYPMQQDEYDNLVRMISEFMQAGYYDGLGELRDEVARLEKIGERQLKEREERIKNEEKNKREQEERKKQRQEEREEEKTKQEEREERKKQRQEEREEEKTRQEEREEEKTRQEEREEEKTRQEEREEEKTRQEEKSRQKNKARRKKIIGYTKNIGKGTIATVGKATKFTGKIGLKTFAKATELFLRGGIKTINAIAKNREIQKILTGAGIVTAGIMIQPVGVALISTIGIHRMMDAVSNNGKGLVDDVNDILKVGNSITKEVIDKIISPTLNKLDNKTKQLGKISQEKIDDAFSR